MENVNQAIPEVTIKLGDVEHKIKCSFGVLARYQKLTGRNPYEDFTSGEFSPSAYIELISSAIYKDPENHLEEIGDALGIVHASQISKLIKNLFTASFPTAEEGKESEGEALPETTPEAKS